MSILACLIGIHTLMISVTMQINQMNKDDKTEEEMARATVNRDLKKKAEDLKKEAAKLEQKLIKEKNTAAEMAKLEDHSIVLRMKLEELQKAKNPEETDASLQKTIENLKVEIIRFKQERPSLDQRLAELKKELKNRKEQPKPVESVVIRPSNFGIRVPRNLYFIECNSTGIIIHSDEGASKPISTDTIQTNEEYNSLLEKIKRKDDSMILFLLRNSGNLAYRWAAGIAETKYRINTSKLPVPNNGNIDLSLFK